MKVIYGWLSKTDSYKNVQCYLLKISPKLNGACIYMYIYLRVRRLKVLFVLFEVSGYMFQYGGDWFKQFNTS